VLTVGLLGVAAVALKTGEGVERIVSFIEEQGLLGA